MTSIESDTRDVHADQGTFKRVASFYKNYDVSFVCIHFLREKHYCLKGYRSHIYHYNNYTVHIHTKKDSILLFSMNDTACVFIDGHNN